MSEQGHRGSIILKILIFVLAIGLIAVIYYPNRIWKAESSLETRSHNNMIALYEAQNYYYNKNKQYVGADSLEKLLTFLQNDSALQQRQKIGQLTVALHKSLQNVLEIPLLKAILPISQSINEISDELNFNSRYFAKYDHIMSASDAVLSSLPKFSNSADFPNFCVVKTYVDSLNHLKERINDYKLQNSALQAQKYLDSLIVYAENIELGAVNSFWQTEHAKITGLLNDIKKTDIVLVSTVVDRTKKFTDRIKAAMSDLEKINYQQNIEALHSQKEYLDQVHQDLISGDNFLVSQNYGQLKLNEVDSTLIKLNADMFYSPDTFGGQQRYFVSFQEGKPSIKIESPNLTGQFHAQLMEATEPIRDLSIYPVTGLIRASLDSTISVMNENKDTYKLSRYSTEILLNMKEVIAEMEQDLDNVRVYRYIKHLETFVDTVQSERKISVLKPMIEDILNPMDTLATHVENLDLSDLVKKMNYYGKKIQGLDSLIQASRDVPANVKRQIQPFHPTFEKVYGAIEQVRTSLNPGDGEKIRQAARNIETALVEVLEGYHERMYVFFSKKHKNYGYVENGSKSWEE